MNIDDLKYDFVHRVANEIMPEFDIDDGGNEYQVCSYAPHVFFGRMVNGRIKFPFTYEQYINNEDIIATLEGYEIDLERFWYAILFIYDITQEKCVNVLTLGDTVKVQTENLKSFLTDVDSFEISTNGKKKLVVNDLMLIDYLRDKLDALLSNSENNLESRTFKLVTPSEGLFSPSIQMWFAANRFIKLFERLKLPSLRAKDHAVIYKQGQGDKFAVGGGNKTVSYNKLLLVSRLMYLMRYTRNDSFLFSDNSLKGILKQYKNYELNTFSKVYFR